MITLFTLIAQADPEGNLGGTLEGLGGYDPGSGIDSATTSLTNFISNIIGFLTVLAGIVFLIYFTVGGITWLTSGGDKSKVDAAKSRLTGGAIGMIVVVSAWAIAWIIGEVLGISFLDPAETIKTLSPLK